MRYVSLWVLVDDTITIKDTVKAITEYFPEYLPNYNLIRHPISNCTVIYWGKITIGDNRDIHNVTLNIQNNLPNCRIVTEEHGTEPTFFKKYLNYLLGFTSGITYTTQIEPKITAILMTGMISTYRKNQDCGDLIPHY